MKDILKDKRYQAMSSGDSSWDGVFFTAVKTTGIYCLPSCSAKNALEENVEFFDAMEDAEIEGYRPCKKCNPMLVKVEWLDKKDHIILKTPKEFSFEECMVYLGRSDIECLHKIIDNELYKVVEINGQMILFKVSRADEGLRISFQSEIPSKWIRARVVRYVWDWFDLDTDLSEFYSEMKDDRILDKLTKKYYGLRVIKIDGIFEALCWAIIGQQINLKFAYTLKKRLVERYGKSLIFENEEYWIFPYPDVIAGLEVSDLREMQFTSRKAEYIISLAKLMRNGDLSMKKLKRLRSYEAIQEELLAIRGVGKWTADYAIMKCFNINDAFPIADVGLHNALKSILGLESKPPIQEIEDMAINWKEWESYATFYLWRWLYD